MGRAARLAAWCRGLPCCCCWGRAPGAALRTRTSWAAAAAGGPCLRLAASGPSRRPPALPCRFVGYSVHELASHAQEHALPLHPSLAEVLKPAAKKGGRKRRREEQPKAQPPPKAQPKQQQQSRAQPPPAAQPAPVVQLKRKRQPKQQQPAPAVQPKKKRQPKQQPPPQPPAAEPVCMLIETTAAKRATKRVWQKYFHMPFCTM